MIIRAPRPQGNFYILDRKISEDKALSWAARGLLIFLLGKPDHWSVSVPALINETRGCIRPTGRDGVYSLLKELIAAGYLTRTRIRADDGRVGDASYIVSEKPNTAQPDQAPNTAQPNLGNPDALVSTEENQQVLNTSIHAHENDPPLHEKQTPPASTATVAAVKSITRAELEGRGVESDVAAEFLALRRQKRARLTPRALAGIEREAEKANISLNDALIKSIERGWQGFQADWLRSPINTTEKVGYVGVKKFDHMSYAIRKVMENEGGLL